MFMRRVLIVCLLLLGCLFFAAVALAQTELVDFTGKPEGNYNLLEWETSTEEDLKGFYVTRREGTNEDYAVISLQIDAEGSVDEGAVYSYKDYGVINGNTYYYRLQLELNSGNQEFSDPITVTFTMTGPVPTSTQTITPTLTPTGPTPTGATATRTSPPSASATPSSRTPTSVGAPGTPTVTRTLAPNPLTPSPTLTTSPRPTTTPTLEPLPEITLLFPEITLTSTPTPTPTASPTLRAGLLRTGDGGPNPPRLSLLAGIIVAVWGLLAGALVLYVKRLGY